MKELPITSRTLKDIVEEAERELKRSELPPSMQRQILPEKVANMIVSEIESMAAQMGSIDTVTKDSGSGDSGRPSQLVVTPEDSVSVETLSEFSKQLHQKLEGVFPIQYRVGVKQHWTVDENGAPRDVEEYSVFLLYQDNTHGSPQQPAGNVIVEHTNF